MLLYRRRYRHPERTPKPGNLAEAEAIGSGLTPVYADLTDRIRQRASARFPRAIPTLRAS
jgi:hypothetical protein